MSQFDQLLYIRERSGGKVLATGFYNRRVAGSGGFGSGGRYILFDSADLGNSLQTWPQFQAADLLLLSRLDSELTSMPEPEPGHTLRLEWPDTGQSLIYAVQGVQAFNTGSGPGYRASVSPIGSDGPETTPDWAATVLVSIQEAVEETRRAVWCRQEGYTASDTLMFGGQDASLDLETRTRFKVRYSPLWRAGVAFDFEGESYSVRSVNKVYERRRYLRLVCERRS